MEFEGELGQSRLETEMSSVRNLLRRGSLAIIGFALPFFVLQLDLLPDLLVVHSVLYGISLLNYHRYLNSEEESHWAIETITTTLALGFFFVQALLTTVGFWDLLPKGMTGDVSWKYVVLTMSIHSILFLFPTYLIVRVLAAERRFPDHVESDEEEFDSFADFDDNEWSQPKPSRTIQASIWQALLLAVFIVGYIGAFAVAIAYFVLLREAIGEVRNIPPETLFDVLANVIPDVSERAFIVGGVYFAIFGVWGLTKGLVEYYKSLTDRNATRTLSHDEQDYISESHRVLGDYIEQMDLEKSTALGTFLGLSGFLLLMGSAFGLIFLLEPLSISALEAKRTLDLDWSIYVDDFGIGALCGIFLSICVAAVIASKVTSFFPNYERRYTVTDSNYGGGDEQAEAGYPAFRLTIAKLVRFKVLDIEKDFDPSAFLNLAYHRFDPWFRRPAFILLAMTIGFVYLDRRDYDLITEDGIETSTYWMGERTARNWSDVVSLKIGCRLDSDNDLDLDYTLLLRGETKVYLLPAVSIKKDIEGLERIDAILRLQHVPLEYSFKTDEGERRLRYEPDCEARLAKRYEEPLLSKIRQLLHLDEIRIKEGLEPLGT